MAGEGADVIDINMGCPSKSVVSGLCGSALMRDPARAQLLIEATVRATRLPVTLKMEPWTNCGWYPSVSFSANNFQFARVLWASQPAFSATLPSGDNRVRRSISPAAAPRCSRRLGPSGAKLPNTNPP